MLTENEIKKIDKRISEINNPFGDGLPIIKKIIEETAEKYHTSSHNILRQYMGWKWNKE